MVRPVPEVCSKCGEPFLGSDSRTHPAVCARCRKLSKAQGEEVSVLAVIEEKMALEQQCFQLREQLKERSARVAELEALINTPQVDDFLQAVRIEAAHQVERWGTDHDEGKSDADWFWLIGYLAGKALHEAKSAAMAVCAGRDPGPHNEKRLHHVITTAAACLNWHRHLTGENTRMRPGIAPPTGGKT